MLMQTSTKLASIIVRLTSMSNCNAIIIIPGLFVSFRFAVPPVVGGIEWGGRGGGVWVSSVPPAGAIGGNPQGALPLPAQTLRRDRGGHRRPHLRAERSGRPLV